MAGFYREKLTRAKNVFVAAVGSRVYVNWTPPAGDPTRPVPVVDGNGRPLSNNLLDGQEVEVLSWRPRSREGLAYQIRRLSDGSEWWIGAAYLRRAASGQEETAADGAQPPASEGS